MRKLILALLLFGNVAFVHANTIQMKLVNVSPGYNDGYYYVYPYNFSLNNSPALTALMVLMAMCGCVNWLMSRCGGSIAAISESVGERAGDVGQSIAWWKVRAPEVVRIATCR